MTKRFCDVCGQQISSFVPRDSKTQFYTLVKHDDGFSNDADICNDCLRKVIDLVKRENDFAYVEVDEDT